MVDCWCLHLASVAVTKYLHIWTGHLVRKVYFAHKFRGGKSEIRQVHLFGLWCGSVGWVSAWQTQWTDQLSTGSSLCKKLVWGCTLLLGCISLPHLTPGTWGPRVPLSPCQRSISSPLGHMGSSCPPSSPWGQDTCNPEQLQTLPGHWLSWTLIFKVMCKWYTKFISRKLVQENQKAKKYA